ncbi:MAG TPA: redoxin domain-containing protein [Alphaproteobacteria bacterium]
MITLRKTALALALIGGLLGFQSAAHAQVTVGKPAPDYSFTDIKGLSHSISGYKGKIIVLEWTNPGCPFVKKYYSQGDMQKLQALYTKDPGIVWIAINSSAAGKEGYAASDADAQKWATESKFVGTAYVRDPEGKFGRLYGAKTTPHMFVIDKDGNVAYQGAIDNLATPDPADIPKAENYVAKAIFAVRAGQKPLTINTPPYGCGVKYADPAPAATAEPFEATAPAAPTVPAPKQ